MIPSNQRTVGRDPTATRANDPARQPSTPFAIDLLAGCLRKNGEPIALRPKTWKLLTYLLERPGELVTKDEILDRVWEGRAVAEEVISVSVRELRRAFDEHLGGEPTIQTVHRRGYRFSSSTLAATTLDTSHSGLAPFVSRNSELAVLRKALQTTREGRRQLVVVSGEAGIGKTALVQQFVQQVRVDAPPAVIGTGQCFEESPGEEPFGPIVEILLQLGRSTIGNSVLSAIRRHARAWLLQLPSLIGEQEQSDLRDKLTGETREHRAHNLIQAIDAIAEDHPLVLVFEDLHWADSATVDLIYRLATRPMGAQVLIVATQRPDAAARGHTFTRLASELAASRRCLKVDLAPLTPAEIDEYIQERFDGASVSAPLRQWFYRQTDGNPLFMVNVAEELVVRNIAQSGESGWIVDANATGFDDIPESLRSIIEHRCSHLSKKERLVLEAASVAGVRFADEGVQGAVGPGVNASEQLATLARRRQMIVRHKDEVWPDGSVVTTYTFQHTLYREVLLESIPARRRADWHRRLGLRLEAAFASDPALVGAELVEHFDRGLEPERSATYLALLGAGALQRFAYGEGTQYFTHAIDRIQDLPNCYDFRLFLLKARGAASLGKTGYGTAESGNYLAQVRELVDRFGTDLDRGWVLGQFAGWHALRGEHGQCVPLAEQLIIVSGEAASNQFYLWGRFLAAVGNAWAGNLQRSIDHYHAGVVRFDELLSQRPHPNAPQEARILGMCGAALATGILADPREGMKLIDEAYRYSRDQVGHDFGTLLTVWVAAIFHALLGNVDAAEVRANEAIEGGERCGLPPFTNLGGVVAAWAQVMRGDLNAIEKLERAWHAHGSCSGVGATICLLLMAQAYGKVNRSEEAADVVREALEIGERNQERLFIPELLGVQAEMILRQGKRDRAARQQAKLCLTEAAKIARQHGMRFWELRTQSRLADLEAKASKRPAPPT